MTDKAVNEAAGAPVPEQEPNAQEVAQALARGNSEDPAAALPAGDSENADRLNSATEEAGATGAPAQSLSVDSGSVNVAEAPTAVNTAEAQQSSAQQPVQLPEIKRSLVAEPEPFVSAAAEQKDVAADYGAEYGTETRPYTAAEAAEAAEAAAAKTTGAADPHKLVTIEKDHPMAGFYTQAPVTPELRGNRLAGLFIAGLATLVFALVYAGVIALFQFDPAQPDNLLPDMQKWLLAPGFIAAVVAFFVGLVLLVMIVGRAGWWAYVLGGFLVGVLVWVACALGFVLSPELIGVDVAARDLLRFEGTAVEGFIKIAMILRVVAAGIVAREVTVWFGAWIGARGRKMKTLNRQAQAEYEQAVAEYEAQA